MHFLDGLLENIFGLGIMLFIRHFLVSLLSTLGIISPLSAQ